MLTAALDTSVHTSFALQKDMELLISQNLSSAGRRSNAEMALWINGLLAEHQLEIKDIQMWIVGLGPGSFTGIRTGIAFVKGICFGSDAVYYGVAGSAALAWQYADEQRAPNIGVLYDGKRNQVILTTYCKENGTLFKTTGPTVVQQDQLDSYLEQCSVAVTPHAKVATALQQNASCPRLYHDNLEARYILTYWEQDPQQYFVYSAPECEPIYVRPSVFVNPQPVRNVQI